MDKLGSLTEQVRKRIQAEVAAKDKYRIDGEMSAEEQGFVFGAKLGTIIIAKSQSDRTGFRRVRDWLVLRVRSGEFKSEVFGRVLGYAVEASGPSCRNPAAVFVKILKEELGYGREHG